MAVRAKTKIATHLLVNSRKTKQPVSFQLKRVISPAVTTLEVSAICSVKWSDKKTYKVTILAMGDLKSTREEERQHGSDDENSMNTEHKRH